MQIKLRSWHAVYAESVLCVCVYMWLDHVIRAYIAIFSLFDLLCFGVMLPVCTGSQGWSCGFEKPRWRFKIYLELKYILRGPVTKVLRIWTNIPVFWMIPLFQFTGHFGVSCQSLRYDTIRHIYTLWQYPDAVVISRWVWSPFKSFYTASRKCFPPS